MTARQAQIWSLYASGHGPTAIAKAVGLKSRGSVSAMIARIKREIQHPVERVKASATCPHSNSCFTCPLKDCVIDSTTAGRMNVLPWDMEVNR